MMEMESTDEPRIDDESDYPIDVPRPKAEMEVRSDLVGRVEPDPALSGDEKGFTINAGGTQKVARVFTDKPTMVKSLLEHDYAKLEKATGKIADTYKTVSGMEITSLNDIYAVWVHVPLGVLTLKGTPRGTNTHSAIMNTPSDSAAIEAAFGGE